MKYEKKDLLASLFDMKWAKLPARTKAKMISQSESRAQNLTYLAQIDYHKQVKILPITTNCTRTILIIITNR